MSYLEHKHSEYEELEEGFVEINISYSVSVKKNKNNLFSAIKFYNNLDDAIIDYEIYEEQGYEVVILREVQTHNIIQKSNIKSSILP